TIAHDDVPRLLTIARLDESLQSDEEALVLLAEIGATPGALVTAHAQDGEWILRAASGVGAPISPPTAAPLHPGGPEETAAHQGFLPTPQPLTPTPPPTAAPHHPGGPEETAAHQGSSPTHVLRGAAYGESEAPPSCAGVGKRPSTGGVCLGADQARSIYVTRV
ncbi:MAG: hypothetical protein FWD59_10585, partial [Micrococcales bacterium]|nr:hypothetical protein [Micrococcales bacterium]